MSQGGLCEFWPYEIDKSLVIAESAFRTKKKKKKIAQLLLVFIFSIISFSLRQCESYYFACCFGFLPDVYGNEKYDCLKYIVV